MKHQITLAVDGNHSVSVSGDDEAELTLGLVWAKKMHRQLRALSKHEPAESPVATPTERPASTAEQPPGPPPLCGIHQSGMSWQRGRRGFFWSCHERLPDGRWCPFKPIISPLQEEVGT